MFLGRLVFHRNLRSLLRGCHLSPRLRATIIKAHCPQERSTMLVICWRRRVGSQNLTRERVMRC
ncbi:hypothetical protein NC653_016771 [Populus alba x Populus x berolinensis]|uniref:Uncharacterized protein n=1 Tax=Populus alba x Populus x berolinensis TaxID=444605 RepID=A0AAD6W046_9ROSI|nr:hypothetical protein NC653_016771 [Populus alba x Populus x berolinensis]